MSARPTSITVIAWILIVLGGFGLLGMLMFAGMMHNPLVQQTLEASRVPAPVQLAIGFAGTLVYVVSGVALLLRQGWARYLYAVWGLASFAYTLYSTPYPSVLFIPSVVLYLVFLFFLFRKTSRTWFARSGETPPAA